jgi:tRNA pseudouridine55 synthase
MAHADVPEFSESSLRTILDRQFHGKIAQTAPKYSALKHQGVPLYELARAGLATPDKVREVELFRTELLSCGADWFELFVHCSKGTYIRALVEDVARALGTLGYVSQLRRVQHGPFTLAQTHTLDAFLNASTAQQHQWLLPIDAGLTALPVLSLSPEQFALLKHGHSLPATLVHPSGPIRLYFHEQCVGLGETVAQDHIKCLRLLREDLLNSMASNDT